MSAEQAAGLSDKDLIRGKPREEVLEIRSLNNARAARARKGRDASFGFKPQDVARVE